MAKADPNEPLTSNMLDEAIDTILEGIGSMSKELRGRLEGMDKRFNKVDRRIDTHEFGQAYLNDWSFAIS